MTPRFLRDLALRRQDRHERRWECARNVTRIAFLRRFIGKGGRGAELGVHKGYFSRPLFDGLDPAELYLVDPWYLQGSEWSWGTGNRRTMDALRQILQDWERELVSGKVVLVVDDDLKALEALPVHHLDWAYLDTTHQYEHTRRELELLKSRVKPGGIIAGDDWQPDPLHRHHGVYLAVHEFLERENYSLLGAEPSSLQWAIRSNERTVST